MDDIQHIRVAALKQAAETPPMQHETADGLVRAADVLAKFILDGTVPEKPKPAEA